MRTRTRFPDGSPGPGGLQTTPIDLPVALPSVCYENCLSKQSGFMQHEDVNIMPGVIESFDAEGILFGAEWNPLIPRTEVFAVIDDEEEEVFDLDYDDEDLDDDEEDDDLEDEEDDDEEFEEDEFEEDDLDDEDDDLDDEDFDDDEFDDEDFDDDDEDEEDDEDLDDFDDEEF